MTPLSNPLSADPITNTIFWIDPEGRILDASDGACRALGYDRETLLTLSVRDVDPEFPADRWPDHWRELRQAKVLHFRTAHRRRDGSPVPVEVTAHHVELAGREYNCALVRAITPQRQTETALRESEERLALALAVSGQGLYDLDIATGRTVFSDEYARMLGHEPSELELTPATWASWLHPEDRERILRLFEDCVTGERSDYRAEFRLRARSGDWLWVLSAGKVVRRDATGRPLRMIGTHLDITERKRAEAVLLESEERFTKAFRASPAPMALSEIETGRFLDVNQQVLAMLNRTQEEMIGRTSTELGVWADPGTREQLIARLRADGFVREAPARFRTKAGEIREVLFSAERIRIGERAVLLSLIYDNTERKRAEAALRASEAFLDSIIAQSPLPIMVYDTAGAIIRLNRATRDLFRVTDEEALSRYNLFRDEQLRVLGYLPLLERVFRAGETVRFQSRYDPVRAQFPAQSRSAFYLDLDSTTFPIRDADGRITHVGSYHLDVTDRKAAETRLRYHLELEQAVAEISALMIKPGWDDFNARMNWALERIGRLTRADRNYLFMIAPDGLTMSNTHEWCAQGIHPQTQDAQNLPLADYQPFYDWLRSGEAVSVQTVALPDGAALKAILLAGDVRSLLCVPMSWGGTLRGFVGLDAVTAERRWLEEEIRLLRMVAEILAHTLQHAESDRILRDNARYLENLDRISRILTRPERGAGLLAELVAALLEIFQADRAFMLYPCDPDAATFHIRIEATRPEWPGVFASGAEITQDRVAIVPDDAFRHDLRRTLRHDGPTLSGFAGAPEAPHLARHYGIQSQMTVALRPQLGPPWVLGVHQCAYDRRWTDMEQRLFQAIAQRVSDALYGHLLLEQLQESEERFAKAFHSNPTTMAISEIETGRFIDVNEQWQKSLGYTREETIGRNATELRIWVDPGTPERLIEQLRESGFIREAPVRIRPKAGDIREALWSVETIRIGDQDTLLSTIFDITERKQTEAALRETLTRLEREMRARQDREAELAQARKLEAIGRLTGGIAHDFNNLLTVIKGNLEILREREDAGTDPEHALFIEDALSAARQGAELTAGLLAFSRQQPLRLQRTRVNRLVQALERLLDRVLVPTTRLRVEIDPAVPDAMTDAGQLQAALLNLIFNAQDAMPEGGTIIVRAATADIPPGAPSGDVDLTPGRYVAVTVSDSGVGMDADTLARACEPFFTTKPFGKGTGLGLATVHGFAAQSGGGIAIDSQPGQGTTVRLFLRALAPSTERTARENHRPPPLPPPIAPAASAAVILVVEDEARVRRLACRHLRDLGYPVLEAADAEEAIAILETEPDIQMVFSDIVMPGDLDGFGLASWIAAHRPEAKCLLATGHHERASDAPTGDAPPLPVLRKPYSKEQLAHQIRQLLGERAGREAGDVAPGQ